MSIPYHPNIDLDVGRGLGLHLKINGRLVDDNYGAKSSQQCGSMSLTAARADRHQRPWRE